MKPAPAQPVTRHVARKRLLKSVAAASPYGGAEGRGANPDSSRRIPRQDHSKRQATSHQTDARLDWRSDTGSGGMSLMMLIAAVALMMILGLVVDGGAKARALDHAGAIASEAARAAAATYRPGDVAIDPQAANLAAQDYLTAAGATGSVTVTGLDVAATATLHQDTVFLPLVGIDAFTVTGSGQAQVVYQQGGTP